jgi:tetratricopeptide (TPR) repeat protein
MATISDAMAAAVRWHQAGRLAEAEKAYRQILAADPSDAPAWHFLGLLADQTGDHEVAVQYIGQALQLEPDYAEAQSNLGNVLKNMGRLEEAAVCDRRAVQLMPQAPEAHYNLGNVLMQLDKPQEAIECYRRAVALRPDFAEAHSNLGAALQQQGQSEEATACCRRAIALQPGHAEAHNNLGNVLKQRGRLDEAIVCYRRALKSRPDFAEGYYNLAVTFHERGELEEAATCYRQALALHADNAVAYNNLGNIRREQGKLDEAAACYRQALALTTPNVAEARWNLSLILLLTGDFERGWPEYEWRWQSHEWHRQCHELPPREFSQPLWDGADLEGKTILIHAEQGLGDTIQFVRYVPLVKQRGANVVLECQQQLLPLLSGFPVDQLVGRSAEPPEFDVRVPLLSLPGIFQTRLDDIPANVPYLFAAQRLIERWRERLQPLAGLRIGIAWQGNPAFYGDRGRSIPLAHFAPLAQLPGVSLISLQKGTGSQQLAHVHDRFPVVDLGDELDQASGPFMDTAAIMMSLDLVITSDTAVAHLAGALGVPVWVALPLVSDWRWLLDRSESPWYPTMRLFRQKKPGDWTGVFEEIQAALSLIIPRQPAGSDRA